ncbi:Rieske 2Fe-2S domain-containing protein [Streptomyces alanosinicus]|uniref:cholesterol 7-desaturase n=1 Tax=Streptomyces alanosinicus TaxID=68171 RepID=A0A918YS55_9ACTN|nr:Rieske 2Fe-2S domain-containing protein [Streptomyces alanosinicus]GHE14682.1 (2Fe-2S)-binding protein [Streptomyces alanosinicus]
MLRSTFAKRAPSSPTPSPDLAAAFPCPEGWYCLAASNEVASSRLITRRLAGEDAVIYRLRDGSPKAIRPYCPHLGAHLGVGGRVEGDHLVCPFHHFAFAPDGDCVRTGYGASVPRARLTVLPAREQNGLLWVWYSHQDSPPAWEPLDIPTPEGVASAPRWVSADFNSHAQMVIENFIDLGHLGALHQAACTVITSPAFDGVDFTARYQLARRWVGGRTLTSETSVYGRALGAGVVIARLGNSVQVLAALLPVPTDPGRVRLRLLTMVSICAPLFPGGRATRIPLKILANALNQGALWSTAKDVAKDIPVWHYSRYEPRPRLAKGDGPIGPLRRWASQFYPAPEGGADGAVLDPGTGQRGGSSGDGS